MRRKTTKRKTTKRRTVSSFLKRVQSSKKVRSIRAKIKAKKAELKKLSRNYKTTLKTESRRLSK